MLQRPVSLNEEPKHRLALENDQVRIYDVFIPPGDATLFHNHALDTLSVALRSARTWTENELGQRRESTRDAGSVSSNTEYSENPRTHRVGNRGETPYQLTLIELVGPPTGSSGPLLVGETRGFTRVHDDQNTVAYRLSLEPGEATGRHRFLAPGVLIRLPDGAFDWVEEGSERELQNPPGAPSVVAVVVLLK